MKRKPKKNNKNSKSTTLSTLTYIKSLNRKENPFQKPTKTKDNKKETDKLFCRKYKQKTNK